MTTAERAAVLDEELRRGYEKFDGIILGERERAQAEINAAGGAGGQSGGAGAGGGGAQSGGAGQPQTLPSGQPSGIPGVSGSRPPPSQTFPPPEDIPTGRDDDVVARQLREAAMREPDPALREALWEEYRKYTGISGN